MRCWTDMHGCLDLIISLADAQSASHSGDCFADVTTLASTPRIARQLATWNPADVRAALKEYGGWDATELADDEANRTRMLWIACGDVVEESRSKKGAK